MLHDRDKITETIQQCAALLRDGNYEEFKALHATIGYDIGVDPRAKYDEIPAEPSTAPNVTPLFIAGLHRSGTTLLENHIAYHFDVSILRADVPENEGQFLENVTPSEAAFGGPGLFGFDAIMRMSPVTDPAAAEKLARDMLIAWAPYMQGTSPILLEKSPPNVTRIPFLRSLFPEAGFIIVTRDPRASGLATMKWARTTIRDVMLHWHTCYSEALKALNEKCMIVRYEDFCDNPDEYLAQIGTFFGLDKRTHKKDINPPAIPQNQNAKYIAQYKAGHFPLYPSAAWRFFGYDF